MLNYQRIKRTGCLKIRHWLISGRCQDAGAEKDKRQKYKEKSKERTKGEGRGTKNAKILAYSSGL